MSGCVGAKGVAGPGLREAVRGGTGRERGCVLAIFVFQSLNMEKERYSQFDLLDPRWCLRRETGNSGKQLCHVKLEPGGPALGPKSGPVELLPSLNASW